MKLAFTIPRPDAPAPEWPGLTRFLKVDGTLTPVPVRVAPRDERGGSINEWVMRAFRQAADQIAGSEPTRLGDSMAFTEISHPDALNPLEPTDWWSALVAMLVLAFPEIHWVFLRPGSAFRQAAERQGCVQELLADAHCLDFENGPRDVLRWAAQKYEPIFDASGLRQAIRARIGEPPTIGAARVEGIPVRPVLSAVLEEEVNYGYFHGYTAYRFGFRALLLLSYTLLDRLSDRHRHPADGEPAEESAERCEIPLVLEDLYLNYPDRGDVHLSDLEKRDNEHGFSFLPRSRYRIVITSGYRGDEQRKVWERNERYLERLRTGLDPWHKVLFKRLSKPLSRMFKKNDPDPNLLVTVRDHWNKMLFKPLSGMFNLWQRSELRDRLGDRTRRGLADGFRWPPESLGDADGGTHSAPGRLMEIADRMLARARSLDRNSTSVGEALHGALLAMEAQELLGDRTPTTALQALALKHKLEVLSECLFYGIEQQLDVKSRLKEIEKEVKALGIWFNEKQRRASVLNAEIAVVNDVLRKFREHARFDEEQVCLNRVRTLRRRFWLTRNRSWAWTCHWARWYVEALLSSVGLFVIAIAGWWLALGSTYAVYCQRALGQNRPLHGLADSLTAFFGLELPHEIQPGATDWLLVALPALGVLSGLVHLGIFVSHLYTRLARR